MLVDDDEVVNYIHNKMILNHKSPVTIHLFADSMEALDHLFSEKDKNKISLILLDINMPEMTSWEFLAKLDHYSLSQKILVVIVTSSVSKQDEQIAQQYNRIIDYFIKPVTDEDINRLKSHKDLMPFF